MEMCLYPKLILNKKYTANKKNGGNIPVLTDLRAKMVPVGCGKCMECRKQKANNWKVRLYEEIKVDNKAYFVTLSFSNEQFDNIAEGKDTNGKEIAKAPIIKGNLEGYEGDNEVCRVAIRRFCERWRKANKKSVKHWFVNEIGGNNTERVHIHGLIWCNDPKSIGEHWKYGNIWVGSYVNEKTITYIVKYLHKTDQKHPNFTGRVWCSPGIGNEYLNRRDATRNTFQGPDTEDNYKASNGYKIALPIYYRNKLFSDEEREILWMQRLDQEVRYVDGVEIDVSESYDEYYEALKEARRKNKLLGYGNDEKDWNKMHYENSIRRLGRKI